MAPPTKHRGACSDRRDSDTRAPEGRNRSMLSLSDLATIAAGSLVGAILGLIGGGGSVLAVPLLVYGVGVPSPHVAIGTSAIAVSVSALANLLAHARSGNVKWPCAFVFTIAGMMGAAAGSSVAKLIDGHKLLTAFGLLMNRPRPPHPGLDDPPFRGSSTAYEYVTAERWASAFCRRSSRRTA